LAVLDADATLRRVPVPAGRSGVLCELGMMWLIVVPGDPRTETMALAGLARAKRPSFGSTSMRREVLGVGLA
jgi:hypothetical protein